MLINHIKHIESAGINQVLCLNIMLRELSYDTTPQGLTRRKLNI